MTQEKMTVHRALAELKVLEARIDKEKKTHPFVAFSTKGAIVIEGIKKGEYIDNMIAHKQKIFDLVARHTAIKDAIAVSNAVTKVVITGREYTVARAIAMKNNDMAIKQELLDQMVLEYKQAQVKVANLNGMLEQRMNQHINATYGNQVADANFAAQVQATKEAYIERETAVLVDPLNITKLMEGLRDEIDSFTAEVDAVLSESNAITQIEIEY